MSEPQYLYHYTDFNGLKGIIDSKKLRFSDYRCMSDRAEFVYSKEFLCLSIQEAYQCLYGKTDQEKLEELCERIWKIFIYKKHPDAYLLCLCIHEDPYHQENGLLSMWRSYGRTGGYALVFDKTKLIEYLHTQATCFLKALILDEKVEYPPVKKLSKQLNENLSIFKGWAKNEIIPKSIDPLRKFNITEQQYKSILHLVTLIKHPGFHEENEYRFCLYAPPEDYPSESENLFAFKPKIEQQGSSVVSFIERPIELDSLAKEIIVGPQSDKETKKEFLEGYLRSQGLTITVRTSDIPYLPH